jgi:hypothetical protein
MRSEEGRVKFYSNWNASDLTTSMFWDIVKRLQAFGLVGMTVDAHKLVENCQLSLNNIHKDMMRSALSEDEIYQQERGLIQGK